MTSEVISKGIWNRSHYLDRMTLQELWLAFFRYPAIIAYLALTALCVAIWFAYPATALETLGAAGAIMLAYPFVWYALHRNGIRLAVPVRAVERFRRPASRPHPATAGPRGR